MDKASSNGSLIVRVSTAGGAIPIENVTVTVQGKDEENSDIFYSLLTNSDGRTAKINLPTVSRSLSESPEPPTKPYLSYNMEVYKEGYYPQHYTGIPIFEGVVAVQNARIIPISEPDLSSPHRNGGQIFDEYENPNL